MLEKSSFRSTTLTVAVISFFGYIIGLTTGFDLFADICSPLCALMVGISIMTVAYAIPRFRISVSCIGIAAFFWFLGDVFYFLVYEMGMDVERFSIASERMYQFTSYMYAIGLVFFIRKEYKGKDVLRFVVHAMLLAICTNILIRTYIEYTNGIQLVVTEMSVYNLLIILVSFFIVIVTLMVIINRGVSNVSTFGVLIFISFLLYGICDNRYSFLSAIGVNAQSYVMDAVALFSVLLSGIAFCHPTIGKFLDENEKLIYRENDYVGETVAVVFTVVGFVMFITKIMPETSFAILFVTCLIYFLLSRSMQATELNKKLLALQEAENARLQQEVVDKQNELMSTNEQLENAMYLDSLSGLHNRLSWNIYSADCLDTNPDVHIILYIIGFNFFELVNDTYGHLVGDRIIKELGRRLKSLESDYIRAFRLGGDEFMISCVDIKQRFDEEQFANLLINLLDRSYEVDDDLIHVTTSIGSASYPDDTTSIERLMSCAEFARSSAKHSSNTCTYSAYSEDDMPKLQRKFMIEKKLQEVDYDRDFRMCYQPQISVETGELVGLEALIRWTDNDIGTVEPEELIPIAEEMGIMSNLGEWVLTESLFQISKWNENYGKELSIGVNISASQLEEENFAEQVMDMIANTGVKSEWVDFEVNEAVAVEHGRRIRSSINRLRKENVTFSVDDFGSGYTSFSRMIDFHFDCIKISEELINRLASSSDAQVVVKSIIDMAHGMHLKVTAEGVEQQEIMNIIRPLGCDVVQGFLFGGALPADEFEATWLQK